MAKNLDFDVCFVRNMSESFPKQKQQVIFWSLIVTKMIVLVNFRCNIPKMTIVEERFKTTEVDRL